MDSACPAGTVSPLQYRGGALHLERVALEAVAQRFGTPCYVYSRAAIEAAYRAYDAAFGDRLHRVCYAVKANSNLAVLNVLAHLGAGFDVVSGGELARVLRAGSKADRVVFSGVGKSAAELRQALAAGIACFNVESAAELERLNQVAGEMGLRAPVALRVNPDVDAGTHPYISTGLKENKFGIPAGDALALYRRAASLPGLRVQGIACHIGSQLTDLAPLREAAGRIAALREALLAESIAIDQVDLGGGLGIAYRDETIPGAAEYAAAISAPFAGSGVEISIEPGRSIVGPAGVLLTRVEYLKPGAQRNFAIVDAAMNDLLRPALYDAHHAVLPLREAGGEAKVWELVGPVCESGDFLAHARTLALAEGDLLALRDAGAYGFAMSSNYNTRPRPAEVMVDGDRIHLIRARETLDDLWRGEEMLAE
ncbi:diaminopimelate decarboxylase [Immundisolibacter cernigliae]|uniref:Diaminopimelate decarboxylase n=1 Tax=Immundisolibacter cernigliae TaxID=1810504 RepID=A0A1B1YXW0_9GAMM|nr:diaminopimelate decarboxylase [Immundisolibacter cernigliae]